MIRYPCPKCSAIFRFRPSSDSVQVVTIACWQCYHIFTVNKEEVRPEHVEIPDPGPDDVNRVYRRI